MHIWFGKLVAFYEKELKLISSELLCFYKNGTIIAQFYGYIVCIIKFKCLSANNPIKSNNLCPFHFNLMIIIDLKYLLGKVMITGMGLSPIEKLQIGFTALLYLLSNKISFCQICLCTFVWM